LKGRAILVEPYLFFNGTVLEAVDFYETVFSGTESKSCASKNHTQSQFPMPEALLEQVMHAEHDHRGTRSLS
jgi:uncharacterized glyoxalase superfamily protein PhnB